MSQNLTNLIYPAPDDVIDTERPSSTTGDASGGAGQDVPLEEDPEGDPAGDLGEDLGEETVEDPVENTIEISDGERDSMDVDSTTTTDSKPQVGVSKIVFYSQTLHFHAPDL